MIVLLNSASGGAHEAQDPERVAAAFRAAGADPLIRMVPPGAAMSELAREAVRRGERIVVAGGGDGSIGSVASALVNTQAALGVLPLGTRNHFARDLGIPNELGAAARAVISGRVVQIDAGEVNGRVFVNNSNLGLYPRLVRDRVEQQRRGWNRWLAFTWAAARVWRRFPVLNLRIEAAGKVIERTTPFVFVGNNEYEVEGLDLGRRRRLDAGCLWLYVAPHRASRLGLLRLALRALAGRLRQHEHFLALRAKEFWIETRRRRPRMALDGEVVWMEAPLHYRIRPQALRVVVPA